MIAFYPPSDATVRLFFVKKADTKALRTETFPDVAFRFCLFFGRLFTHACEILRKMPDFKSPEELAEQWHSYLGDGLSKNREELYTVAQDETDKVRSSELQGLL